mmetsp:Transcript_143237/g.445220  ORF Transcript_143237/g.445220 Transcript_143237/m.445220 type:complete len:230 (-) Transcript_143237:6-695(-)
MLSFRSPNRLRKHGLLSGSLPSLFHWNSAWWRARSALSSSASKLVRTSVRFTTMAASTPSWPNISLNFCMSAASLRNSGGTRSTSTVVLRGAGMARSQAWRRPMNVCWARKMKYSATTTTYQTKPACTQQILRPSTMLPMPSRLNLSAWSLPVIMCSGPRTPNSGSPTAAMICMHILQNSSSMHASRPAARSTSSGRRASVAWIHPKKVSEWRDSSTRPRRTLLLYTNG